MADIESNIKVNIDTSDALSQLKLLQQQISAFQQAMRNAGAANASSAAAMQQNLITSINATGKFRANIQTIKTSAESFTEALEKNKMSIGEYFRYAGGASKTFGKLFKSEFQTIQQVAVERVKTLQTQYIKLGRDANGAMKAIAVKPLALDMENVATKTQIAAQRQQLFNQLMKQGSTQLLNFGKNTQWAGRQLMVGFTIPLTLAGSAAAKAYMQIEQASIKFRRVYGDMNTTTAETDKMVKSIQAMANEFTKYGLAVSETMDMAASAAAMGKTGADLMAQVAQASKLAVLGGVEQQQALDTTISLTNAFKISTDQLAGSVDFLNAVENQTVLSIEDMTIAIPKAAPVIQQLGGDVKDLAFFLTAMREGGINASEGANALKSGLASMINPTAKASQFLQSFGINMQGIVEANKGDIRGTVIQFSKALDTLDPLNRARAIEQMFGKFQFSRLSTLFQNVIAEGSQANNVLSLSKASAEELAILSEREMKKVSDSPMFKFQKSIQDMQAKLAPVGEAFLKAVTPIIEFVTKILDGFNNLGDGAKQFITILVTAVAGIGPILLMTFGLIANGVANIMKLFTNIKAFINKTTKPSDLLGEQTQYMTTEQIKAAAIAASLDQAHSKLKQTFTSEAAAVDALTQAYRRAVEAQQAYSGIPGVPVGNPNVTPKKYAGGVHTVPGPKGAGDIVPALLSPGEAVIPAKMSQKYAPVIRGMIAGNLPGFEDGTPGAGMRQSTIGPLTEKQTEGLARTGKTLKEISDEVYAGPYNKMPITNFGTQISETTGHSFPAFGVGGIYQKPDGNKVFVKPQIDATSALAEIRGTEIARSAHGLVAPQQKIAVMMDPTDPENKRKFIVLESPLDERLADVPKTFSKENYIKQLVASLLRGDKDLGVGNLGENILADVGTAGVFQRASGKRTLGGRINSMEEQAIINLLGVKGGAKRFFAESTAEIAKSMTPAAFDAAIKAEIQAVMPKLDATIAGFGPMSKEEKHAYANMANRLAAGLGVDWTKYHAMHSSVIPRKYNQGIENVPPTSWLDLISPEVMEFLPRLKNGEMQRMHMVGELEKDENSISQVQTVLGRGATATPQNLQDFQILGNLTADVPGWINQYLRDIAPGIPSKLFNAAWNSIKGKMFSTAAASTDEKGQRLSPVYHSQVQEIEDLIGNSAGLNTIVKDKNVDIATKQVLSLKSREPGPMGVVARAFSRRANLVGDIRSKLGDKIDADGKPISQTSALRQGLIDKELTLIGDRGAMIGVPGLGNKIKLGEIRSQNSSKSPEGQADIAARQRWFDETGGDMSQFPTGTGLRIRGASGFPGLFGFSTTGTVAYSETSPNWSSISDMDVFDKFKFAEKNGFRIGDAGFLKLAKGGVVPGNLGPTGKPKASVFDIDDTLLDLSSFMPAHQERNKKLPKEQRLNWWEEVAKDPKGIPAAIQRLKEAQMRGNKIILMTARPKSYDEATIDTLKKLGIDMNGVKLISRENKDYRKPEQMKYDKTSKYRQWYDIEEFYDDMAKTRGALSLMGINAIDPLKLAKGGVIPGYANGVFSVPGPKGAGDVVPAMLSPGEAVIPAKQAAKHRPMIQQMIAGNLPGYNKGTDGVPGYFDGIPGVPKPPSVPSEPEGQSTGFFAKIATTIIDSSRKAGDVLVSKAKDAGEKVAGQLVDKYLNPNNDRLKNSKGEVINEDRIAALEEKEIAKKQNITKMSREQIEEEISLTDEKYKNLIQEQKLLKAHTVMSEEQRAQFQKNEQQILATEQQFMSERNIEEKKQSGLKKAFTRNKFTGAAQGAMYGATGLASTASMIPGVDKAAQAALPAIGAMTGAMSMIPGPAGMVVGGLLAVATIAQQLDAHFKALRDEAAKATTVMGASTEAMKKLSEFSKKVGSRELMDKRREDALTGMFYVRPGKQTFGEAYMQSEAGKELATATSDSIKTGNIKSAAALVTSQMGTAIAAGILSPEQARSVVANLAKQIKSTSFAIDINAKISTMFGPDGTKLDVVKNSIKLSMDALSVVIGDKPGQYANANAAAAGSGAVNSAMLAAMNSIQAGVDAVARNPESKAEDILAANDYARTQMQKIYTDTETQVKTNKDNVAQAARDTAIAKYKDTSDAKLVEEVVNTIRDKSAYIYDRTGNTTGQVGFTDTEEIFLTNMIGSGILSATNAKAATNMDIGGADLVELLTTNAKATDTLLSLASTSGMTTKEQRAFMQSQKGLSATELDARASALTTTRATTGAYFMDDASRNKINEYYATDEGMQKAKNIDEQYKALKGKKTITFQTVLETVGTNPIMENAIKSGDFNQYFSKFKDKKNKVIFTTQFNSLMNLGTDELAGPIKAWLGEKGMLPMVFGMNNEDIVKKFRIEYSAYEANRVTESGAMIDDTLDPNADNNNNAPEASWLDQYVKNVRDAGTATQKLTTGFNDSSKALKNFASKDKDLIGLFSQLKKAGVNGSIIEQALGGDEATTNKLIDRKTGQLKAGASKILKGINDALLAQQKIDWLKLTDVEKRGKYNEMYTANLDVLKISEDKINKTYDDRVKALDEIRKLNDRNLAQQQSVLSIGEALSRGDIGAAAQAALEMRKQNTQYAIEEQKNNLEKARLEELKAVTVDVNGVQMTRAEIEEKIRINQEKITKSKAEELEKSIRIGQLADAEYAKIQKRNGKLVSVDTKAMGGLVTGYASGGMVIPKGYAVGGGIYGTDTVPAMLTPGEFVIRKSAVDAIGASTLNAMNSGASVGDSVYNYTIQVNVKSDVNASQIADTVLKQIEKLDAQRLRSVRI